MARILVIEDNAANRKLTLLLLHHAGHETVAADDAASGIEAAQTRQPDLILMDIQLPDIDGLAATRELKADPRTAHIPIVALTAFAMKGDEKRMLAAGCIAQGKRIFLQCETSAGQWSIQAKTDCERSLV